MFRNFLKTAFRNLFRQRFYSAINLFGLATGVACCMLIVLWVADELSYDRWNPRANRIYRINADINFGGNHFRLAVAPTPMAAGLQENFPEVETTVRFRDDGGRLVKSRDENFREPNVLYADSTVFEVFPLPILAGESRKPLTRPGTVAISESRARKYFGSPDAAVGKVLTLDNTERYEVTTVFQDIPRNTHFHCDFFLAMAGNREAKETAAIWLSNNFHTYFILREGADAKAFEAKLNTLVEKYVAPQVKQMTGMSYEDLLRGGAWVIYSMIPLTRIHLYSDWQIELEAVGDIQYVYVFSAIALFILLIACINFMNLSTARSARRAREIGVRKALGSQRRGLIAQFLTESTLLSALAFLLALGLVELVMPWYNDLTGKSLSIPYASLTFAGPMIAGIALVGLLAGSYPALFLSGFNPIRALRGQVSGQPRNAAFRGTLVVFQFVAAVFLITGTMLVYRQLSFIQNKNLGFDKEQVIVLNDAYALGNQVNSFKEEMLRRPDVVSATVSGYLPVPSSRSDNPFTSKPIMEKDNTVSMQDWRVDYDYIKTLGMEIVKGRDFSREFATDSSAIILNETAARLFNFDDPIGKKVYQFGIDDQGHSVEYTVVGVVKDFNYESLRRNIGALGLRLGRNENSISFRVRTGDLSSTVAALEASWQRMAPGMPFQATFLDEAFDEIYRAEQRVGRIVLTFALLSIFVSCLGLFGLAAYTAERRTKEIGIRKVLGASVPGLVGQLSKDFLRLVFIAIGIALPLAWLALRRWLEGFAYRTDMEWWIFLTAGILAILVAFLTVGYQSFRAARANPVAALKYE